MKVPPEKISTSVSLLAVNFPSWANCILSFPFVFVFFFFRLVLFWFSIFKLTTHFKAAGTQATWSVTICCYISRIHIRMQLAMITKLKSPNESDLGVVMHCWRSRDNIQYHHIYIGRLNAVLIVFEGFSIQCPASSRLSKKNHINSLIFHAAVSRKIFAYHFILTRNTTEPFFCYGNLCCWENFEFSMKKRKEKRFCGFFNWEQQQIKCQFMIRWFMEFSCDIKWLNWRTFPV